MAVQKSKKSTSRRDMRRAHDALSGAPISESADTGELHRRHHITADGWYRGRQVIKPKAAPAQAEAPAAEAASAE